MAARTGFRGALLTAVLLSASLAAAADEEAATETPAPVTEATTPAETPAETATAVATATATPVVTATETPIATPEPTPEATPEPTPMPRPSGVGAPILFRGECTPGGGASGCRIVAAGVVTGDALGPIPCVQGEPETRKKIAARYFDPGTPLDLYVRGAPGGTFVVAAADEPPRGCSNRARGRKVSSPGRALTFVALDPEDPVKLGPLRFPSGVQASARAVVVAGLEAEPYGATPQEIGVHEVRRLREGDASVLVAEASTSRARVVLIAEGNGSDPAAWTRVWASDPAQTHVLVDAFDLGADGTTEILLEREHRGEQSEWVLLRRVDGAWKSVSP